MKKIPMGILGIVLIIALVGTEVWAYFQDTETSTGNVFQAGILYLKIRDQPGFWPHGVSGNWTMTNMAPGDETPLGEVELHIDSASISADHLEITCDYTDDEMAKVMVITLMRYYKGTQQVNLLTEVEDVDGDGKISLYDLKYSQGGNGIDNLLPPYGVWHFEMKIKFDEDAGNEFQGKTLDLTMIFTLNQDPSQ